LPVLREKISEEKTALFVIKDVMLFYGKILKKVVLTDSHLNST